MTQLTVAQLLHILIAYRDLDVSDRDVAVASMEYDNTIRLLQDVIGASHCGCAADEVLLDLEDGSHG